MGTHTTMLSSVAAALGGMFTPKVTTINDDGSTHDTTSNQYRTPSDSVAHPTFLELLPNNIVPSSLPFESAAFANKRRMGGYLESSFMQNAESAMKDMHADTFYPQYYRPFTQSKPPPGTNILHGDIRPHVPNYDDKAQTFKFLAMTHRRCGQVDIERSAEGTQKQRRYYYPQTPVQRTFYSQYLGNTHMDSHRGW